MLEPGGAGGRVVALVQHGEVLHEGVGSGAVPVFLARRAVQRLAGMGLHLLAAAGLNPRDALGDVQGLAPGV